MSDSDAPPAPTTRGRVAKVFIVDSHPAPREGLAQGLAAEPDFEVCGEADELGAAVRAITAAAPDAVVVSLALRRGDGLELVKRLKDRGCPARMLVWSSRSETVYAERALRAGALGFISKAEPTAAVVDALRRVLTGEVYLSPEMMSLVLRRTLTGGAGDPEDGVGALSDRELEVFRLTGQGEDTVRIADHLRVSPKTVETYKARVKEKLGLDSSTALLMRAVRWVAENQ